MVPGHLCSLFAIHGGCVDLYDCISKNSIIALCVYACIGFLGMFSFVRSFCAPRDVLFLDLPTPPHMNTHQFPALCQVVFLTYR